MANPASRLATRIAYGTSQLPRIAWYLGHAMVMRRLSKAARERDGATTRRRAAAVVRPARARPGGAAAAAAGPRDRGAGAPPRPRAFARAGLAAVAGGRRRVVHGAVSLFFQTRGPAPLRSAPAPTPETL